MVIRKKEEKKTPNLDAIILKGGRVSADNDESRKWSYVNLRLPSEMLEEVDKHLKSRVGITRNGWILQLIHGELQKGS